MTRWTSMLLALVLMALVVSAEGSAVAATQGKAQENPPAADKGHLVKSGAQKVQDPGPPDRVSNRVRDPKGRGRDKGAVPSRARKFRPGYAVPFSDPVGVPALSPSEAGWIPQELNAAYQIPAYSGGKGKLLATVVAYDAPNVVSDLAGYRSAFGLAPCTVASGCLTKIAADGTTNYPAATSADWAAEATLDVEMFSAACPNCRILLIEAKSNATADLMAGVERANLLGADAVNMSWGGLEYSGQSAFNSKFSTQGRYFAASGDCYGGCGPTWPATSPSVLSVGGTNLQRVTSTSDPSGSLWAETPWADTSSGCSAYESVPSWQSGTGCGSRKATPDVSANAGTAISILFTPPGSTPSAQAAGMTAASAAIYGKTSTGKAGAGKTATSPATTSKGAAKTKTPTGAQTAAASDTAANNPADGWGSVSGWQGAGGTSASAPLTAALYLLLRDPAALAANPGALYYGSAYQAGGGPVNALAYCGGQPCYGAKTGLGSLRGLPPRTGGSGGRARFNDNRGHARPKACAHGDPVMCASGNLAETVTDIDVPARGQMLNFTRAYNSQAAVGQATPGPLGMGWTTNLNPSLAVDPVNGDVTVTQDNGTTTVFTPTSGGKYGAAGWVTADLVKNGDGTYTYTLEDLTSTTFSSAGVLVSMADRNGYGTTLGRDGAGRVSTLTEPGGRKLTFAYNTGGQIASITDPAGQQVTYGYDGNGRLTSVTDQAGKISRYGYDTAGQMTTMTNANGGVTTNVFDSNNRVSSQTDPAGRKSTYAYASDTTAKTSTTTITDPLGVQMVQVFDQYGNLIRRTEGANTTGPITWTYTYQPGTGQMISATDPNGHTTSYVWDASGNQLATIDPLGRASTATYNSAGDVLTSTDPAGMITTNTYTANHNLASTSTPVGDGTTATTSYTYAAGKPGDLVSMSDPNGNATTYTYDTYGNQASASDAAGDTTTWTYDPLGRKTKAVTPRGNSAGATPASYTSTWTYDPRGRMLTATDPLGHKISYVYDALGNQISVTDPVGNVTTTAYTADNEPTTTTNPDGTKTTAGYDENGRRTSMTDANGQKWTYIYNLIGRYVQAKDPTGWNTIYTYDPAGNRTSLANAQGYTITWAYDAADQVTSQTHSDGLTPNVTWTYDAVGRRMSMTDGTGTSTWTRDKLGRVTRAVNGVGEAIVYRYDKAGNTTGMDYRAVSVTRGFDAADRMTSLNDGVGHTTTFGYDPDGNLTSQVLPNGITSTRTYDPAGNVATIKDKTASATVAEFAYTRNADDLVKATTETTSTTALLGGLSPTTANHTYGYTPANRLASADGKNYTYDPNGNLTANPAGDTLTYAAADQLATGTDSAGKATTYTYDPRGRRIRTVKGSTTTDLGHDQLGRMTSYGTSTRYTYDGDGLLATRIRSALIGTNTDTYLWDTAAEMPTLLFDSKVPATYIYGPGGMPVEQVNGSTMTYFLTDELDSVRQVTSSSASPTVALSYDPYGKPSTTTTNTSLGYTGELTDSVSGLVFLRARWYDPTTSQFVTIDPALDTTHQPYTYTDGDPLNATDPLGLWKWKWKRTVRILDVASVGFSAAAAFADATVLGAPAGVVFGGISTGLTAASAGVTCKYGNRRECRNAVAWTALSAASLGTSAGFSALAKGARIGAGSTKAGAAARAAQYERARFGTDAGPGLAVPWANTFAKDPCGGR